MQRESFKLAGAAALDAQLAALETGIATDIGRAAVKASAEVLKDAWVAGMPYDPKLRGASKQYGHARDNVTIGPVRNQNVHAVVYKVTTGDAYWIHIYEYGSFRQPARPTLRPINDRMKGRLIEVQIETLTAGIAAVLSGQRA